ncbi:hypothetical protein MBTS_11050 [Methylobacterium bullatum]|nr:hypothetical protein [Methylobacterium bullatum]
MMTELAPVIRDYVSASMQPVLARLEAMEKREPLHGKDGSPGVDGRDGMAGANGIGIHKAIVSEDGILLLTFTDGSVVEAGLVRGADGRDGINGKDGSDGRDGADGANGKDADPERIILAVAEEVAKAISALPVPRDGADGRDGTDGTPGERGQDGKDADPEEIAATVASEVSKAVAALPVPQNGKDGRDGIDGKDGVGLASALIGRNGELIVTLTNGDTKDLGLVIGKDGASGRDGSDGKDGAPGADGLGFDDMTETVEDDGRTIVRRYQSGDEVKEFRHTLAVPIDRGVYKDGQAYKAGDGVTLGGSWWLARKDTQARPDGGGEDWRLAVKRGRDGKDGKDGERGLQGKTGEAGKDLTQLGPNGQKW